MDDWVVEPESRDDGVKDRMEKAVTADRLDSETLSMLESQAKIRRGS